MITGATIAQLLQKQLPAGGFSETLCQELRTELSRQLFQLTQMLLTQTDAVFYKLHDSEHIRPDLELLWLPEDASLD